MDIFEKLIWMKALRIQDLNSSARRDLTGGDKLRRLEHIMSTEGQLILLIQIRDIL
jgi:hypothetical protein